MKRILFFISFFISIAATAQVGSFGQLTTKRLFVNEKFYLPVLDTTWTPIRPGVLSVRPQDSLVYRFTGVKWELIGAGGSQTLQQTTTLGNKTTDDIEIVFNHLIFRKNLTNYDTSFSMGQVANGKGYYFDITNLGNSFEHKYDTTTASRNYYWPDASGIIPISTRINGVTYTANQQGLIDLGTIASGIPTDTSASINNRIANAYSSITSPNDSMVVFEKPNGLKDTIELISDQTPTYVDSALLLSAYRAFKERYFFTGLNSSVSSISYWPGTNFGANYSGTGSSVQRAVANVKGIGYATCLTGTTTTGYSLFGHFGSATIIGMTTDTLVSEYYVNFTALSNGTDTYTAFAGTGRSDFTGQTHCTYFVYTTAGTQTGSASSVNWQCVTANSSSRTWTTTSIPVTTAFQKLTIKATSTTVLFYVNNVLAATHTTNIPSVGSMGNGIGIIKTAGTTSTEMGIMYYEAIKKYATSL